MVDEPDVEAVPLTRPRDSWRWNSRTVERAVQAYGVDTRRSGPVRFVAGGLVWQHTCDPSVSREHVASIRSKQEQRRRLAGAGLTVVEGREVRRAEDAVRFADGRPVVVKPLRGAKGRRVTVGAVGRPAILRAVAWAQLPCVVETVAEGDDLRVFAFADGPAAAVRRDPPHVVGDGRRTLGRLVEAANRTRTSPVYEPLPAPDDPRRVPAADETVVLSRVANVSTGGTSTDVSGLLSGRYAQAGRIAARAVAAVGLSHGGVDLVGDTVIEVNHAASLRVHLHPAVGDPRRVDMMLAGRYYR